MHRRACRARTGPARQQTRIIVDLQAFPASLDIVRASVIVNQTTSFARRFTRPPKAFGGGALPRMARLEFARRFGNNRAAFRLAPQGRFAPRAARAHPVHPKGQMMKFLSTLATSGIVSATLLFASVMAQAQERIAVGTLNGEPIWLDEIMAVAQTLPPEYREGGLAGLYTQLVDEVANARLAAAAGRDSGLDREERVANAMKLAADRVLAEAYMTDLVAAQITEDAIQTAYDNFVADEASRETVTASHILVETEDEAKGIIAQLNDGADFAELAREKSTGPSGPNGGELGSFGRGQMVPAFENAAFEMPVDSYSGAPVQTQFGWHVIKVSARDIAPAPTLDQMREQIVSNLSRQTFARVVETLRAGAAVDVRPYDEVLDEAQAADSSQQ
jgi:peptidyl-prolyl cis-trans isomerase C